VRGWRIRIYTTSGGVDELLGDWGKRQVCVWGRSAGTDRVGWWSVVERNGGVHLRDGEVGIVEIGITEGEAVVAVCGIDEGRIDEIGVVGVEVIRG
jgi:hypothetical protein